VSTTLAARVVDRLTAAMDHYLYLDETGTLDFEERPGEAFFGVGTAHFAGAHGDEIWQGHELRCELESTGVRVQKGLHAKNDSAATRAQVYTLIASQAPRFDSTMLRKANAFPRVREAGKVRLYKMALWLHLKHVVYQISDPGDRIFMVVGHLQTSSRRDAIRQAVMDVCAQTSFNRQVIPCIWDAPTAWGIQVADYLLWRVQREVEGKTVPGYTDAVASLTTGAFAPWGK
jgi:hypothetical protein